MRHGRGCRRDLQSRRIEDGRRRGASGRAVRVHSKLRRGSELRRSVVPEAKRRRSPAPRLGLAGVQRESHGARVACVRSFVVRAARDALDRPPCPCGGAASSSIGRRRTTASRALRPAARRQSSVRPAGRVAQVADAAAGCIVESAALRVAAARLSAVRSCRRNSRRSQFPRARRGAPREDWPRSLRGHGPSHARRNSRRSDGDAVFTDL